jgi:hypothetical protein
MAKIMLICLIILSGSVGAQQNALPLIQGAEPQPLIAHAIRLKDALNFLGSSLQEGDAAEIERMEQQRFSNAQVKRIQQLLDPYCLAMVQISPEARVKVIQGAAAPVLMQHGWKTFLVKVHNEAGVTARLEPESKNALPLYHISSFQPDAKKENYISPGQLQNGFVEMAMYRSRPMNPNLSGQLLEYAILQIYSKDAGDREVEIGFNVGQGSQDIGFRNTVNILFDIASPVKVFFTVQDDDGSPAMASFTITDGVERALMEGNEEDKPTNYRFKLAANEFGSYPKHLNGIYPLPSRRLASVDEYPDFFFQPQVYRTNGEHVYLPPGTYQVQFTRGPEYTTQTETLRIPEGADTVHARFKLKRWIHLAQHGWFSADHHVHAAGCSHYESPEQGVLPKDMWRQQVGEDLNVAAVLTWGPGWYHQKQFFTGHSSEMSTDSNVMRYDVEVSGFPSSHAGHIVLLNLKEDDYPGTHSIEDWPSWTLPVLQWAKSQGGVTGYAHSGWGLEPAEHTSELPNYVVPKMDGIGANEYVVTVTQKAVDFYSAGDTPFGWEMNMWYHTLNTGFRTRISGETDFPCIYDERVGLARSYFKPDGQMNFNTYIDAIKKGRSYVSEGRSHIIDFKVEGIEAGTSKSEIHLDKPKKVAVTAKVAGWLPAEQDAYGSEIAKRREDQQPYWHVERARIGMTRSLAVELLVNGEVADTAVITANGSWHNVSFRAEVNQSSWLALRIRYSCHTNPVFVLLKKRSVSVQKSGQWCVEAVDQCWKMKKNSIRPAERAVAESAYLKAREVYRKIASVK